MRICGGESVTTISKCSKVCILGIAGTRVKLLTGNSPVGLSEEVGVLYDATSSTYSDVIPASGILSYTGGKDFIKAPSCVLLLQGE